MLNRNNLIDVEDSFDLIVKRFRQHYSSSTAFLRRAIADDEWSIDQSFVNLALILKKDKDQPIDNDASRSDKNKLAWHDWHVNRAEQVYGDKRVLAYSALFESVPEEKNPSYQKIFLQGAAGSGKTTLCQRIAYDWSQGEASQGLRFPESVKLVVWIKLRNLQDYLTLGDLENPDEATRQEQTLLRLPKTKNRYGKSQLKFTEVLAGYLDFLLQNETSDFQAILQHLDKQGEETLYLLDGYDEIAGLEKTAAVQEVFEDYLLKQPWVWVTSRPHTPLPQAAAFRQVELLGFRRKDCLTYAKRHFGSEFSEGYATLKTVLMGNSAVGGLAHIPVNLEILCTIVSGSDWLGALEDDSVTSLYTTLVAQLVRRTWQKGLLSAHFFSQHMSTSVLSLTYAMKQRHVLSTLGALALEGLPERKIVFSVTAIEAALQNVLSNEERKEHGVYLTDILSLGLLRGWEYRHLNNARQESVLEVRGQGEFLHLMLQEFFAAWHFSVQWVNALTQIKSSAVLADQKRALEQLCHLRDVVARHKYAASFARVWPFVTGFLKQKKDVSFLNEFVAHIESAPLELKGSHHEVLVIRCLEELLPDLPPAPWCSFLDKVKQDVERTSIKTVLSEFRYLQDPRSIELRGPRWGKALATCLVRRLNASVSEEVDAALSWVRRLGTSVWTSELQKAITTLFTHEDSGVRRVMAEKAESYLGAHATPALQAAFATLFTDAEAKVRQAAAKAVGHLGQHATPALLAALATLFTDADAGVRREAAKAVGRLRERAIPVLLNVLATTRLTDVDRRVRFAAALAIGGWGPDGILTACRPQGALTTGYPILNFPTLEQSCLSLEKPSNTFLAYVKMGLAKTLSFVLNRQEHSEKTYRIDVLNEQSEFIRSFSITDEQIYEWLKVANAEPQTRGFPPLLPATFAPLPPLDETWISEGIHSPSPQSPFIIQHVGAIHLPMPGGVHVSNNSGSNSAEMSNNQSAFFAVKHASQVNLGQPPSPPGP